MITQRERYAPPGGAASGCRWVCLLTALLFALQVTYIRIHLLTGAHYGVAIPADASLASHHDHHHSSADHDHGHDTHQPHPAGDHEFQLAGKRHISLFAGDVLLPETSFALTLPAPRVVDFDSESNGPPGESPPDPLQPRAPPTA